MEPMWPAASAGCAHGGARRPLGASVQCEGARRARGLEESGALFAPPTYIYVVSLMLLIVVGLYRIYVQDLGPMDVEGMVASGEL
jgi:hypothetical protein